MQPPITRASPPQRAWVTGRLGAPAIGPEQHWLAAHQQTVLLDVQDIRGTSSDSTPGAAASGAMSPALIDNFFRSRRVQRSGGPLP